MKTSIWFLLGIDTSFESRDAPCTAAEFIQAFHASIFGTGLRLMLGPLRFLSTFSSARRRTHDYLDFYIRKALQEDSTSPKGMAPAQGSLVKGLASQTDDILYVRSQILQGMLASQETTAVLVSNTMLLLSRNPKYWAQLRQIVLEHGDALFTFDNLSHLDVVQQILAECKSHHLIIGLSRVVLTTDCSTANVSRLPNDGPHGTQRHHSPLWWRTEARSANLRPKRHAGIRLFLHPAPRPSSLREQ
jgi:cytochrome P450